VAFRINEFKTQMDWFGGPARGSLFQVIITPPAGLKTRASSRDLTFFCKNASIPGMTLNSASNDQVAQKVKMMPQSINLEPVQCIFMLDSDHQILSFFHLWMQQIVNFGTQGGAYSEVAGKLPYEVGYKEDYACRITIRQYSTNHDVSGQYYEVILDNAFPLAIGDIDLAWDSQDSFSVLSVSFQYDRIEMSGERVGIPSGRGTGLLGLINKLGNVGNLIGQSIVPTSIQNAVNKYTRVNNSVNKIKNFFG
jgi:hypothetical protein